MLNYMLLTVVVIGHNCVALCRRTNGTVQFSVCVPRVGPGHPSSPLVHLLPHLFPFYFSLSFIGFTYFILLSIPSLSTRIVPLRFQAGGRRRRPNLVLVCFFCVLLVLSVFLS